MMLIQEALVITGTLGFRLVLTPASIAMLIALGLCAWIVAKWAKRKI